MFPETDNQVYSQDSDFKIAIMHIFKEFQEAMNKKSNEDPESKTVEWKN